MHRAALRFVAAGIFAAVLSAPQVALAQSGGGGGGGAEGGVSVPRKGGASGAGEGTGGSGAKTPATSQNGIDPHSMEECMKVWDPATHMTKEEWRITCQRTLKSSPMDMLGTP